MTPKEIKALRDALDLNQVDFLARLGIKTSKAASARQMVSRWELGTRNPSGAALVLLERLRAKVETIEAMKAARRGEVTTVG